MIKCFFFCVLFVFISACSTTQTITTNSQVRCPWPEPVVIPKVKSSYFPSAPVIDRLPPITDTVLAASHIRASRKATETHNSQQQKNINEVNDEVQGAADDYNEKLEEKRIRCKNAQDAAENPEPT